MPPSSDNRTQLADLGLVQRSNKENIPQKELPYRKAANQSFKDAGGKFGKLEVARNSNVVRPSRQSRPPGEHWSFSILI
jgi:hypothetical protein